MTPLALAVVALAALALVAVAFALWRLHSKGLDPRLPSLEAERDRVAAERDRLAADLAAAQARARDDAEALGRAQAA
ncbi:MAG TPA: hypothetical protein VIG54_02560, partial [Lysobacter sp.]